MRVLAIDQTVEEKNGQRVVVGKTATLELTPGQAETLALAQQLGTLSLALRSIADASNDKPSADDEQRGGSVNIVRFGVSTTTTTAMTESRGPGTHGEQDIDPHRRAGGADPRRRAGAAARRAWRPMRMFR